MKNLSLSGEWKASAENIVVNTSSIAFSEMVCSTLYNALK
jgi:hypothetical protein